MISSVALAGGLNKVVPFDIKGQALDKALLKFGAQAHVQMSVAMDSVIRRLKAPDLRGNYTGRQALTILLKGTNLTFRVKGDIVEVSTLTAPVHQSRDQTPASTVAGGASLDGGTDPKTAKKIPSSRTALQEVVITGSRLPTTSKYGPQEVQIYDREKIDESGQTSVAEFLSTLPSVSASSLSTALGIGTTVQLRGLPVGTTLVLLDGRRLETSGLANYVSGQTFFDLNNIPLAAVQSVEVEENGASAIYGSDALAGVINIILKKDFAGFAVNTKYTWAKDLPEWDASVAWGQQWDRAGFSIIGSYSKVGGLLNTGRLLTASNDYTQFGGQNNNYQMCSRANVYSTTGAPLSGAPAGSGATYAAVTGATSSGEPAFSQFTYGALTQCPLVNGFSLQPHMYHAGLLTNGHVDIGPGVELFTELLYTHLEQDQYTGYPLLFGVPGFQSYTVSAANPYNPFGTSVGITGTLHDLPESQDLDTDFFRPLVGIKGLFARRWHWEASAWQSIDWTQDTLPNLTENSEAIQNALNSADLATALNPFVIGPEATPSVLSSLTNSGDIKWMGRDRSAEGFIRGPLFWLPAGSVQAVVGGNYERSTLYANEIYDGVDAPNTRYTYGRTYYAVFGEARVPLIAGRARWRAGDLLTLTVSGRHDHYSDFGGATTEQFGLEVRPIRSFLLRGTYGTAFQAPSLTDLYSPETVATASVTDPRTGASELAQLIYGGNPKLRPVKGHSHTIGVVYSAGSIPGLVLSLTQWLIVEDNAIQSLPQQVVVNNEDLFPGLVIRNSAGVIQQVVDTDINFGSIDVTGMDYQASYHHPIAHGTWSMGVDGTEMFHYRQALTPGATSVEAVSQAEDDGDWAPKWKGTVSMGAQYASLTVNLDGRYTGAYRDYDSTEEIGNFWIADAYVKWDLQQLLKEWSSSAAHADAEIGATNLFNKAPQFSNFGFDFYGYDPSQMSIVGRSFYVGVVIHW